MMTTRDFVKAYNDGFMDGSNETLSGFMQKLKATFEKDEKTLEKIEITLQKYITERNGATE